MTKVRPSVRPKEREKAMIKALALVLAIMLSLGMVPALSESAVEVTLWHYFESSNDKLMMEQRVDEYNRLQDRIHINAVYISRQEMMRRYAIGAISGQLPDIGMVDSPDMASFISLGLFMDITDALNAWGELDRFYPGPLASCRDADGRLYGLPQNTSCLALAVNTDLMKAAGYDRMPETAEEFAEMARAAADPANGVYGFAMSCIDTEEGAFQLLPWLGGGVEALDGPEAERGLSMLAGLMRDGAMSPECVGWNQADAWYSFCQGRAAMVECGTWHLSMTGDIGGAFHYDFCLLPTGAPGATGATGATGESGASCSVIGGENFGLCAGCADPEGCLDFLKWLCSAENEAAWAVGAGKIPSRDDCRVDYPYEQRGFQVFADEMKFARARGPHPDWPAISETLRAAAQSVFVDEADPRAALAAAAAIISPMLDSKI